MTFLTMPVMKKKNRDEEFPRGWDGPGITRLHASTMEEITAEVDRLEGYFASRWKVRRRKLTSGPMLALVIIHFLDLPVEEQEKILAHGKRRAENLMRLKEPVKAWRKARLSTPLGGQGAEEGAEETAETIEAIEAPAPRGRKRDGNPGA
jgi:hypothetical protein